MTKYRFDLNHNDRRHDLLWRGDDLYRVGSAVPLMGIVPDGKYAGMWRVRLPNGKLTDMVNRARAKDAAEWMVFEFLRGATGRPVASPMRFPDSPATTHGETV